MVPDSNRVNLVYGLGFGTAGIGRVSPVAGKLLTLTGEGGGEIRPAQTIVLEASLKDKVCMKNITTAQVATVFRLGTHRIDQPIKKALEVNGEQTTTMKIVPIPPYFVYDGFEQDLDATMVYKRVMHCQEHDSPMRTHVLEFLCTCMIGQWRTKDIKPFLPVECFHRMLSREARQRTPPFGTKSTMRVFCKYGMIFIILSHRVLRKFLFIPWLEIVHLEFVSINGPSSHTC